MSRLLASQPELREQLPVSAPRLAAALLRAAPFAPQLLARVARAAPSPELSAAAAEVRLGLFSRLVSFLLRGIEV